MLPPLVNAHTHVYSGLARLGMPRPDPAPRDFLDILARVWWRLDRALDHEALRAAARLGFHPNVNTATVVLSFTDFERFLAARGNPVTYV